MPHIKNGCVFLCGLFGGIAFARFSRINLNNAKLISPDPNLDRHLEPPYVP